MLHFVEASVVLLRRSGSIICCCLCWYLVTLFGSEGERQTYTYAAGAKAAGGNPKSSKQLQRVSLSSNPRAVIWCTGSSSFF